jgi:hypothetical protein
MYGGPTGRNEKCLREKQHEPCSADTPCAITNGVSDAFLRDWSIIDGANPTILRRITKAPAPM